MLKYKFKYLTYKRYILVIYNLI